MVFQNYALYPHMTVRDNIAFPLKMQRLPKTGDRRSAYPRRRACSASTSCCTRKPRELSGGQRQRVAMGRAIVRHPQAFLMDEPLSNLDAKLRVQMRAELVKLHRRLGVTTLYVTHDQTEAMTLGTARRGPATGRHPAGRRAPAPLPPPGEHVRRELHRLAADELRPRGARRRGARARARSASSCPRRCAGGSGREEGAVLVGPAAGALPGRAPRARTGRDACRRSRDHRAARAGDLRVLPVPGLEAAEIGERPIELAGRLRRAARPAVGCGAGPAPDAGRRPRRACSSSTPRAVTRSSVTEGPRVVEGEHAGWRSLTLGNGALRVTVLPDKGAEIVELVDVSERGRRSVPCAVGARAARLGTARRQRRPRVPRELRRRLAGALPERR